MYAVLLKVVLYLPEEVSSEFLQNESPNLTTRAAVERNLQRQLNMVSGAEETKVVD